MWANSVKKKSFCEEHFTQTGEEFLYKLRSWSHSTVTSVLHLTQQVVVVPCWCESQDSTWDNPGMGTCITPSREISPRQDLFPYLPLWLYQLESPRLASSAKISTQPGHGVSTPTLGLCWVGVQECCSCSIQGTADFSLKLLYCNLFTLTHLPTTSHHTASHLWRKKKPQTKHLKKHSRKSHTAQESCSRQLVPDEIQHQECHTEKLSLFLHTSVTWGQKAALWRQCHGIITISSYRNPWK